MTNFQHLQEPSVSVSTLKSVQQQAADTQHAAADPLSMVVTHAILDTLHMEEKTHVVDTNHQVTFPPQAWCLITDRPKVFVNH